MRLIIDTPARVRLVEPSPAETELARTYLTYHDSSIKFQIQKHRKNRWWRDKDFAAWNQRLEELQAQFKRCILFEDSQGYYTYSGLAPALSVQLNHVPVESVIRYPTAKPLPWAQEPQAARPYQIEMRDALLGVRHGAISAATGLGKTYVLMSLVKELGLQTVIMVPSKNIAYQTLKSFERHLGSRYVGLYGDGKKQLGKLVTIGIDDSLTRIQEGTEAWNYFRGTDVCIVDESHLVAAATLESVCMNLLANAPYRFFVSATQMRMDGAELVLGGIIGPVVKEMSLRNGVDQGWLARPRFKMVRVHSPSSYEHDDPQRMAREHFNENPEVLRIAADIANKSVKLLGHQVLILIDELNQFNLLLPRLQFEARLAHGGGSAQARKVLPKQYVESDPTALVEAFDRREFPILVGTSCISTGTDIQNVETCIVLLGGKSDIQITQGVGRTTRRGVGANGAKKTQCNVIDFCPIVRSLNYDDVNGALSPVFRHALARAKIYNGLYGPLQWLTSHLQPYEWTGSK